MPVRPKTNVPPKEWTHRFRAANDKAFLDACTRANVKPTRRQYARWHQKRGQAYAARQESAA